MRKTTLYILLSFFLIQACSKKNPESSTGTLQITSVSTNSFNLHPGDNQTEVGISPLFSILFSAAVDTFSAKNEIQLKDKNETGLLMDFSFSTDQKTVEATPIDPLSFASDYELKFTEHLKGVAKENFPGVSFFFHTHTAQLNLVSLKINDLSLQSSSEPKNIQYDSIRILAVFSDEIKNFNAVEHISFTPQTAFNRERWLYTWASFFTFY